ncbi:MAG: TraB/GumN family protein [Erythrobacter sp.]
MQFKSTATVDDLRTKMKPVAGLVTFALLASTPGIAEAQYYAQPSVRQKERALPVANFRPLSAAQVEPVLVVEQDYEPTPAIWKLADNDTTIYLFGTFHILPRSFRWRSPALEQAIVDADELVLETSNADSEAVIGEVLLSIIGGMDERTPTSERLSPDGARKWARLAQISGMPLEKFDRLPPMIALLAAGVSMSLQQGSTSENGVETVLEAEFADAGKPIGSIENAADVVASLLGIDEKILLADIEGDLARWDGKDASGFVTGTANARKRQIGGDCRGPATFRKRARLGEGLAACRGSDRLPGFGIGPRAAQGASGRPQSSLGILARGST